MMESDLIMKNGAVIIPTKQWGKKRYFELKTNCQRCKTPITFLYTPTAKSAQAVCSGCDFLNTYTFEVEG